MYRPAAWVKELLAEISDFRLLFVAEDSLGELPFPFERWQSNKNYLFLVGFDRIFDSLEQRASHERHSLLILSEMRFPRVKIQVLPQ